MLLLTRRLLLLAHLLLLLLLVYLVLPPGAHRCVSVQQVDLIRGICRCSRRYSSKQGSKGTMAVQCEKVAELYAKHSLTLTHSLSLSHSHSHAHTHACTATQTTGTAQHATTS